MRSLQGIMAVALACFCFNQYDTNILGTDHAVIDQHVGIVDQEHEVLCDEHNTFFNRIMFIVEIASSDQAEDAADTELITVTQLAYTDYEHTFYADTGSGAERLERTDQRQIAHVIDTNDMTMLARSSCRQTS